MPRMSFNWEFSWIHVFMAIGIVVPAFVYVFNVSSMTVTQASELANLKQDVQDIKDRTPKVYDLLRNIDQRLSRIEGKLDNVKP